MSVPVSKAVLLRQTRIPGFTDPAAALQFAERVAGRYRRPALHDAITTGLAPRLREFRLLVTAGDRLRPTNVALIAVVLQDKLDAEDTKLLRNWRLKEKTRLVKASGTITLGPIRFRTSPR